jgi:hypothetical protein
MFGKKMLANELSKKVVVLFLFSLAQGVPEGLEGFVNC